MSSIMDIKYTDLESVGIRVDKLVVKKFNNLSQYGGYLHGIKDESNSRDSSHKEDESWSGTSTFDEALDLILRPNLPPPVKIATKVADIENRIKNALQKKGLLTDWIVEDYHYDVDGTEFDIAKLVEGNPECYLKPNVKYKSHFYDLHINFAISWNNSIDTIVDSLTKVIAVVLRLEKAGFKIRLYATGVIKNVTNDGKSIIVSIPIKHFDEIMQIDVMARVLYPSFFRRLCFKILESEFDGELNVHYGQSVSTLKGVVILDDTLKEEDLYNRIVGMSTATSTS